MHEVALCESILESMKTIGKENRYPEICSVTVEIGAFQMVVPESLDFAFQALTKGTDFEATQLIQKVIPARARCRDCNQEQILESFFDPCSSCGSYHFEMLNGMELNISQMEVVSNV